MEMVLGKNVCCKDELKLNHSNSFVMPMRCYYDKNMQRIPSTPEFGAHFNSFVAG